LKEQRHSTWNGSKFKPNYLYFQISFFLIEAMEKVKSNPINRIVEKYSFFSENVRNNYVLRE